MKPETEKQFAATLKAFKPIEAYIAQKKKIAAAFEALEEKVARTEAEHKSFLQKAGALEAKRLLGEANDADAQVLDTDLIAVRDQQDRLAAAHQALELQQEELDRQVKLLHEAAGQAIGDLRRMFEADLDQEMQQAASMLTSAVNRLYAFRTATGTSLPSREIMHMKIPSLVDGTNLFQEPARFHPHDNRVIEAGWEKDKDAKALHDRLRALGIAYSILHRDERRVDDVQRQAEREAEQQRAVHDAA
ncbi:MAG: hypothetical protein AB7Q04_12725 [Steroidobacteraceae bacterium]